MLTIPYTYLIGWPDLNLWYYGVRYADGCQPSDFWVKYFTSSKGVEKLIKSHGQPPVRLIRKTFPDKNTARLWETRVLKRLNVVNNKKWINQNDRMAPPIVYGPCSPERAAKISATKKSQNIVRSPEWRANHSKTMKGKKQNPVDIKKRQEALKNTIAELGDLYHTKTPEFRKARSESMIGNKNPSKRPDVVAKISASLKGKPWSEARRLAQINRKSTK